MIPPAVQCGRHLRRLLHPLVLQAGATPGANRYRKHFPATAHLWLLVLHVLAGTASLRQSHGLLAALPGLFGCLGLRQGISRSQLTRATASRDPACAERLFAAVVTRVRAHGCTDPRWQRLTKVQAVDSTFLGLVGRLSPWSRHGGHAPGVRVHVGLDLAGAIPTQLHLTGTETHDAAAFDQRDLTALAGWTLVMDLGYYGHARFARLQAAGVSWLCPLHAQASYTGTAAQPVPLAPTPAGDTILADQTITLGSPNNRAGAVLPGLRLITSQNPAGVVHRLVTDRHDLDASEVVTLYRTRWQIELFFRWLKHQLHALHPFGASRNAVWWTVLICAIVALLLALEAAARPVGQSRVEWLRGIAAALQASLLDSS